MSDNKLRRLPLAAAALLVCFGAQADYTSPDGTFRMSGFGTLGVAKTNNDEVKFNYPGQGGGASKDYSIHPDSKVAIQGTQTFTNTVSATAQIMTKYDAEGDYIPKFEWAFAKWQAMPGLNIRAGRMGAPYFMISDFRDVGYANTPVRPNLDVYGQVPVSSFDGVDVSYQFNVGSATLTSTLWTGNSKADFANTLTSAGAPTDPVSVEIKRTVGLNLLAEFENGLSIRFGHAGGKLTVGSPTTNTLIAAAQQLGALGLSAEDQAGVGSLLTRDSKASFTGIGLAYDQNDIVLATEFTKRKNERGIVADTTGWYFMGGYRFGSFLPYVSWSRVKVDDSNGAAPSFASAGTVITNSGGAAAPALQQLIGGTTASFNTQKLTQRTISAGVRWDVASGFALKAQFDHVRKPANSAGMFLVPDAAVEVATGQQFVGNRKNVNVVTLSVDFVF